jgi:hypothetical protein
MKDERRYSRAPETSATRREAKEKGVFQQPRLIATARKILEDANTQMVLRFATSTSNR